MSMEKILEKVDAIEASNISKIEEVKSEVSSSVEAVKVEIEEKFSALEAKVSAIQIPEFIRTPAKTVRQDVNRSVREQLKGFAAGNARVQSELKIFESVDQ